MKNMACCLALAVGGLGSGGCIFNSGGSGSGSGSGGGTDTDTASSASSSASDPSAGTAASDSAGEPMDCYDDTTVGCQEISWNDVVLVIDTIYLFQNSYYGYSKQEALDLARSVYDNGVVPQSYLEIVSAYPVEGGYRVHVVVTAPDGYPVTDLQASDFELVIDGGEPSEPVSATALGNVDPTTTDLEIDLSMVIDDSGSVADCDANFVAQGLAFLLENVPAVYEMSIVKFASEVFLAHERSSDTESLINAVLTFCTDRGSTALWDAVSTGNADLPNADGFEAVIVFTDGLDNESSKSLGTVIDEANASETPVFILGLGLPDMFALLELATGTGGAFVYVNSGQKILEGFETLTDFIRNSYVLDLDLEPATLEVRVALPTGTVSDAI